MRFRYPRAAARRKRARLTKENPFVNRRLLPLLSRVTRTPAPMARSLIEPGDSRMSGQMLGWWMARPMVSASPGVARTGRWSI